MHAAPIYFMYLEESVVSLFYDNIVVDFKGQEQL